MRLSHLESTRVLSHPRGDRSYGDFQPSVQPIRAKLLRKRVVT